MGAVIETKKLALKIALLAKAKKAQGVVVLDMRNITSFCDYFVVMSGESFRQVNAFAEIIDEELSQEGIRPLSRISPHDESGWVVLDYVSIIVHVFHKPIREFYALERLWQDAKKVRILKRAQ